MAYSPLTTYKRFTTNKSSGRGVYKPIRIAVHHMAGNLSVEQCGNVFVNNKVSAHYGINGKQIGCYVDESDTAWALGNFAWNQKSINIECANDGGATTNWHVSDATIETCINLIVDIAYRLGWTYIAYDGTLSGSDVIAHRWVASTACPGNYLYSKLPYIAKEADKRLKAKRSTPQEPVKYTGTFPSGTVKLGSRGSNVVALQKFLNWYFGNSYLSADGVFGPKTYSQLKKFQGYYKSLVVDGICGPKTIETMKAVKK